VAKRLGPVRRALLVALAAVALAAVAYLLLVRESTVTPRLVASEAVAVIGSGSGAVAVADDGTVLAWMPPPREGSLPKLPIDAPPKGGRLLGPVLEQAKVLGAAPAALRPYLEGSYFGESGVDVKLTSGVELRFGNAGQAARKWRAAAAVLADPSVTALDYVDLHAPSRPSTGGSGHTLPPLP
jgi:Cell division protein FtsQ/DivIB, C-terminal